MFVLWRTGLRSLNWLRDEPDCEMAASALRGVGVQGATRTLVESRMGAVARDAFRFPSPLVEPDVPVASIRLSDRIHSGLTDERLGVSPDA